MLSEGFLVRHSIFERVLGFNFPPKSFISEDPQESRLPRFTSSAENGVETSSNFRYICGNIAPHVGAIQACIELPFMSNIFFSISIQHRWEGNAKTFGDFYLLTFLNFTGKTVKCIVETKIFRCVLYNVVCPTLFALSLSQPRPQQALFCYDYHLINFRLRGISKGATFSRRFYSLPFFETSICFMVWLDYIPK